MEVDGGGGGSGSGENVEMEKKKNSPEGETKVKRKMKTPSQLEALEKTYAMETYPSEALRAELSVKLGLTDRQLQMWFCHRRLKDRKPPTEKRQKKSALPASAVAGSSGGIVHEKLVSNVDVAKDSDSSLSLFGNVDMQQQHQRVVHKVGTAVPRISSESPSMRRFYETPRAISEQRAIKFVEAQLGEPLREDGPILGMEFDPLPPGAFGAPFVASEQQKPARRSYDAHLYERLDAKQIKGVSRALQEYQFLPEKPSMRNDAYERTVPHYYGSPSDVLNARVPLPTGRPILRSNEQLSSGYLQGQMPSLSLLPQQGRQETHLSPTTGEVDTSPPIAPMVNANIDSHLFVDPITGLDDQIITPDRHTALDLERLERKRKAEEARIAKEVEAHEKRIRKELEKQDVLRRKKEEQMRKEIEKQDRERRKEEERLLREKQREEERCQREQRREMERREKYLQKEYIRAEKMRLKEEMRREKEAARLKAANDKAAARKIAKESTELIDDERLELMELAASSRELPSILSLDNETLQNLDLFKDKLPKFPPERVHLKRPFEVQPWTDSEENVGNLLMVWRFLISFADVLGLWPFTLDEFTQALHDSDPRLLGEIHIALLRSIIKDIEDVARTPDPNSAGILVGGHTHIVEGAYAWGFDLLSWQRHLTPLTWPEVLRQFVLSAGFGPKLKKLNITPAYLQDDNEGDNGADAISNLRSGAAAQNAVAIMHERGFSNSRRSQHRLTPGTVKFAAFHILSLEGSKGLSILEVADKIQRSGLRDLTTSKTPEASISAALSRDTKLFERTAPSTYCVRSPYRKDADDAETILSAALERIRVHQNGDVDEEAGVEKDDVEIDHDSESDVGDEPDVDDLDAIAKLKVASHSRKLSRVDGVSQYGKNSCSELMEAPLDALGNIKSSSTLTQSVDEIKRNGASVPYVNVSGINSQTAIHDLEDTVIDECGSGEPWVQGLTEGEYADLSTEERLNALVALIRVANEGNAVRMALEERMEAANALKKQMWAEAQLDKRRMKEEHTFKLQHSSLAGNRSEQNLINVTEHRRSPISSVFVKNESSSINPEFQLVDLNDEQNEEQFLNNIVTEKNPLLHEFSVVPENLIHQQSVYATEKSRPERKAFIGHRAEEIYVYRSLPLGQDRRRNRYWQFITSLSQKDPGCGRIFVELCNGIWRLIDTEKAFNALLSSLDIRGIRESHLYSMLQNIGATFKETARKNLLRAHSGGNVHDDIKGDVLEMRNKLNYSASYSNSPGPGISLSIDIGNCGTEDNVIMRKYKDFEWMWNECYTSNVLGALKHGPSLRQQLLEICDCCHYLFTWEESHCPTCHRTYSTSKETFGFAEHVAHCIRIWSEKIDGALLDYSLPPRIRLLKVQLATIEASVPSDAFGSVWSDEYRKSWGRKLHMASTAEQLLQCLTLLEDGIKMEFLSPNYETTSEILSSSNVVGRYAEFLPRCETISVLPWMPQTTAAVALRLMEFDASIYYTGHHRRTHQKDNEAGDINKFPSIYSLGRSMDNVSQVGSQQDSSWAVLQNGRDIMKRGRGRPRGPTRARGGKSQRRATNPQDESCSMVARKDKIAQRPGWKGRSRARGSSKKASRSIRSRQKPAKRAIGNVLKKRGGKDIVTNDAASDPQQEEWNLTEAHVQTEGAENENVSSSERSEFEEENGQASADEFDDHMVDEFSGAGRGKSGGFTKNVEYKIVGKGDEHVEDEDEDEDEVDYANYDDDDDDYIEDEDGDDGMDEQDDYYAEGYINSDYNEEGKRSRGGEQVGNVDRSSDGDSATSSSEYSY
ncbi:hypothetical protein ACS0TY_032612 [Phlomoides rotata]